MLQIEFDELTEFVEHMAQVEPFQQAILFFWPTISLFSCFQALRQSTESFEKSIHTPANGKECWLKNKNKIDQLLNDESLNIALLKTISKPRASVQTQRN